MEGYTGITPILKKIQFRQRGRMDVVFEDGRILSLPLSRFPSVKKLPVNKRHRYTIANGKAVIWQDSDEVYHVQDFLGLPEDYCYKG